jgi:hypothetical protein
MCQGWGRRILEKDQEEEEDDASDHHESTCHFCQDGGGESTQFTCTNGLHLCLHIILSLLRCHLL